MSVTVDIKGVNELQATFSRLSVELQRKVAARAVSAAAKVIRDEVTARAPVRQVPAGHKAGHRISAGKAGVRFPGTLKARIVRRRRTSGVAGNKVTYEVGPAKMAWYGRLVEMGTKTAAAHPFMRPAIDAKGTESIEAFRQTFADGIDEAVRASR